MTKDIVEHKTNRDIEIAREHASFDLAIKVRQLYRAILKHENEFFIQITLIYHLGVVEGKRQERIRRKKSKDCMTEKNFIY